MGGRERVKRLRERGRRRGKVREAEKEVKKKEFKECEMREFTLFFLHLVFSWLLEPGLCRWSGDYDVINYNKYYYLSVRGKMGESLSASNCTIGGAALGFKFGDPAADLQVKIKEPEPLLVKQYTALQKEADVYFQTNVILCQTDRFKDFTKGFYKRAKGCFNYTANDMLPYRKRVVNRYAATLHPDHIRCDNKIAADWCPIASKGPQKVPDEFRRFTSYPFVVNARE